MSACVHCGDEMKESHNCWVLNKIRTQEELPLPTPTTFLQMDIAPEDVKVPARLKHLDTSNY